MKAPDIRFVDWHDPFFRNIHGVWTRATTILPGFGVEPLHLVTVVTGMPSVGLWVWMIQDAFGETLATGHANWPMRAAALDAADRALHQYVHTLLNPPADPGADAEHIPPADDGSGVSLSCGAEDEIEESRRKV